VNGKTNACSPVNSQLGAGHDRGRGPVDPVDHDRLRGAVGADREHGLRPKNTYVREDHVLARLPALLADVEFRPARKRRRTRRGVPVVRPISDQDLIGCLRAREITLVYDPRTKTLQADTTGAVTTVTSRAS